MDARELLQTIEARGGVATLKTDASGAAKINVASRILALEFLPELQRFQPALLELLATAPAETPENRAEAAQHRAHSVPALKDATGAVNGPQIENLSAGGAVETLHLARAILECVRPGGGFDFGAVKPYWRAANKLTGANLTSQELGEWARCQIDRSHRSL